MFCRGFLPTVRGIFSLLFLAARRFQLDRRHAVADDEQISGHEALIYMFFVSNAGLRHCTHISHSPRPLILFIVLFLLGSFNLYRGTTFSI